MYFRIFLPIIFLFSQIAWASDIKPTLPRFVSTRSYEVNMRIGPGVKYPIEWVLVKKGEPLEVIKEFEQWRYVRDFDNSRGWIHSSVLSNTRVVIVNADNVQSLYKYASKDENLVAYIEPLVRCNLKKCSPTMCKVKCEEHSGWMDRKSLWGVLEDE